MDITTLALAKKYVKETIEGAGALKGVDGKSAYEIAIDNGFIGTEQEWLISLQGEQGQAGKDGVDGKDGAPGKDGTDGKDGIQGPKGDIGPQGPQGETGPKGDPGEQGPQGDSYTITTRDYEEIAAMVGGISDFNTVTSNDITAIISGTTNTDGNLTELPVCYYKIEFNSLYASSGNTPVSAALTELEFYDSEENKVVPIEISADSTYGDSVTYAPSKLIDGNLKTLWSSKNTDDTHWLKIRFANGVLLNTIKIAPRSGLEHGVPNSLTFYAGEIEDDWLSIGYFENLKDTWIDETTFQDFSLEHYKADLVTNKKIIDFNGLKQYHTQHGILKANIDSPVFTGTPKAITPEIEDDSDRLATTQFVQNVLKDSCAKAIYSELSKREHEQRMREWDRLGLGLFIHWGIYAAWDGKYSGINELGEEVSLNVTYNAEWLLCNSKMPVETYKSKSDEFTGELWNAEEIAKMAYQAGMKYIVITSKHHEGFSLFPNENSSWDINDTPCRNTILQELKDACDRYGLKFCLYFSQCYDWAEEGGFGKEEARYLGYDPWTEEQHMVYMEKTIKSLQQLVETYDPYVIWYDMGFKDQKYVDILLEAQELYWPNVIVNNRLASNKKYGDFSTPERVSGDGNDTHSEACFTLNNTWGYNSSNDTMTYYNNMSLEKIFKDFIIDSIGKGQNCLLNIGPKPTGFVPTMQKSRLNFMSKFFQKYGMLAGGQRCNKISYPDWGYMIKINENTLKCFIYEPNTEGIYLYGFDPTYIETVRVYDADDEYAKSNYEIDKFGIKLFNPLTSYSYDEYIEDFNTTITNNANIGVVEIKFSQPIMILEAKPLDTTGNLSPRNFSTIGTASKEFNNNKLYIPNQGSAITEFIWAGDSGLYSISKAISSGGDASTNGKVIITNCIDSTQQIFELDNLVNDTIENSIVLFKGFRYKIEISRTSGSTSDKMLFSKLYFESNLDDVTYTEVDHISATKYQYIDTEFAPTNNTKVQVDFMQTAKNTTKMGVILGLEDPRFIIATETTNNKMRFDFGSIKEQYTDNNSYTILNNRYTAILDKGKCYINDVELTSIDMSNQDAFEATSSLWLFADSGYPQDGVKFIGNIYSAKIWDNDVLVRDFVPVQRDYDKIYGMLDKVNNKFYRSMTTTDFTCD